MKKEELILRLCALKRSHLECDDSFYSCPMSADVCTDRHQEGCNCGAEAQNKEIDEIIEDLKKSDPSPVIAVAEISEEDAKKFLEEWKNSESGQIIYKEKEKSLSYLLFGKEVCEILAEDGLEEAVKLIEDGAEYELMETDGSNLPSVMSQLENYGGYCFLTQEQYTQIFNL
jgi:hypothetical protein